MRFGFFFLLHDASAAIFLEESAFAGAKNTTHERLWKMEIRCGENNIMQKKKKKK